MPTTECQLLQQAQVSRYVEIYLLSVNALALDLKTGPWPPFGTRLVRSAHCLGISWPLRRFLDLEQHLCRRKILL